MYNVNVSFERTPRANSRPSGEVIKCNIQTSVVIKTYQKYIATIARVGYATRSLYAGSGPIAEGVLTNKQRGRELGPCLL